MQVKIKKYFFLKIDNFIRSIAFLPTVISIFFIIIGIFIIKGENNWVKEITNIFPFIRIHKIQNYTTILTTLLTGIISLTIFSFSMVMIVMNQAASSYTPKILALIVEQKSNQIVLGFYIGTILYYLIILIYNSDIQVNLYSSWLSFYLSVLFAMTCIILFVNFIHSVSVSVQVKAIVDKIFTITKTKILKSERRNITESNKEEDIKTPFSYSSRESGYFQSYLSELPDYLKKKDLVIRIDATFGEYLLTGNKLFSTNREIDEETRNQIQEYLYFDPAENIDEHSFYGFYQISEIAVKALSPGVNNIGIALICIDYLIDLFSVKAANLKSNYVYDSENNLRVVAHEQKIQTVFYESFTPIREYGKTSTAIVERMMRSFQKLAVHDLEKKLFKEQIIKQTEALVHNADNTFTAHIDRVYINEIISSLNEYPDNYYRLPLLK